MAEELTLDNVFMEDVPVKEEVETPEDVSINTQEEPKEETPEVPEEPLDEPLEESEEPVEEAEEPEEPSVIGGLKDYFGYELDEEFEDNEEGLKKFTLAIGKKMAESEFEELGKNYPDVLEYTNYRLNGGEPDKWFKVNFDEPDYSKIEITEDNEVTSKEVIKSFYKKQGFSEPEILELIKDYEDTGILHKQAAKTLPKLINNQKEERKLLKEQQMIEAQQQQEQTKKIWQDIETKISGGDLNGLVIPEAEKTKFFDWIAVPTEEGKSAMQIAEESMTIDQMLAFRYLLYKGGRISGLVSNAKKTQQAESLRDRLSKGNNNKLKGTGKQTLRTKGQTLSVEDFI